MDFFSFTAIIGIICLVSRMQFLKNFASLFSISSIILILFLAGYFQVLAIATNSLIILGNILLLFFALNLLVGLYKKHLVTVGAGPAGNKEPDKRDIKTSHPCGLDPGIPRIKYGASYTRTTVNQYFQSSVSIGTLFFILFGTGWYILSLKTFITGWDEFFWAAFTKAIKHSNAFYTPKQCLTHFRYPPGVPLFQYFFLLWKNFSETGLFFANGLIILSGISVMIDFAEKKLLNIVTALVISAFLLSTFYFPRDFVSIMLDPVLGFVFGAGLIIAFFQPGKILLRLLTIFPIIATLSLIKETGLVFAVILASTFLMRTMLEFKWEKNLRGQNLAGLSLCILIIIAGLWLPHYLWSSYINSFMVKIPYSSLAFEQIKQIFFPSTIVNKAIVSNFYDTLLIHPFKKGYTNLVNIKESIIPWSIIFTFVFSFSFFAVRRFHKNYFPVVIILFLFTLVGFFGYILFMIFAYQNYFPIDQALKLSSFDRYMTSYIIGFGFLSLSCLTLIRSKWILGLVSILIFSYGIQSPQFWNSIWNYNLAQAPKSQLATIFSNRIAQSLTLIKRNQTELGKMYVISQNTGGLEHLIFSYQLWPNNEFSQNSLGEKYRGSDTHTKNLSINKLKRELKKGNYNSLILLNADKNFWSHYAALFSSGDIQAGYIAYSINFNSNNDLILKPIVGTKL